MVRFLYCSFDSFFVLFYFFFRLWLVSLYILLRSGFASCFFGSDLYLVSHRSFFRAFIAFFLSF